ncbi:uncharacterized protein LOC128663345 isoform X1 [Bombina bombina]|uniref:uncharacterized protein LOC128663345 isoform X1 n=1 Tax=Bombina bombina TaxID=8345 RepID=UPI00235B2847|nr:uncharacterized protein LOC128663345 isoform X1 [Bombina bombina]
MGGLGGLERDRNLIGCSSVGAYSGLSRWMKRSYADKLSTSLRPGRRQHSTHRLLLHPGMRVVQMTRHLEETWKTSLYHHPLKKTLLQKRSLQQPLIHQQPLVHQQPAVHIHTPRDNRGADLD